MKNKEQHFVPASYLRAWVDPATPLGQTPYVWLQTSDGKKTKNKDPKNIFTEPNYYTMPAASGERDLWLEHALGSVEKDFPRIRQAIIRNQILPTGDDLEHLCLYAALMLDRVKSAGENMLKSYRELHEMTLSLERQHNAPRTTSLETEFFASYGHHFMLTESLKTTLPFLSKMNKALVFPNGSARFITSDRPCYLFDPKAYQLPPFYRSPGFSRETVELRIPLAPEVMFVALWGKIPDVVRFQDSDIEDLNKVTRFKCADFFVTQTKSLNRHWFDSGAEPEDSWEKVKAKKQTPERGSAL